MINYYQRKRDAFIQNGSRALAAFYQILMIQEMEEGGFSFLKRSQLKQLWRILGELSEEILGISDINYQKGIFYEVVFAGGSEYPSEEKCRICDSYFAKSGIKDYVPGAYQIHINGIQDIMREDADAAQRYGDQLLMLLEERYGKNSFWYAKMKLHILGECFFLYKKDEFLREFGENYEYFRKYVSSEDYFFIQACWEFACCLVKREDRDCERWIMRLEKDVRQWRENEKVYYLFQCEIAWLKARKLEMEKRYAESYALLKEAILTYLSRDSDTERIFYGFVYLAAAYDAYQLSETEQMLRYARQGLAICEKQGQRETELYYNLYNYIGIWHMRNQNWGEAEKLYACSIPEIIQKFGRENENYVIYMSNLAYVDLNQGKDATPYFNEIQKINSKELKKKFWEAFQNELNYAISRGDSMNEISAVYQKYIRDMENDDSRERERLDSLYLSARIRAGSFGAETKALLKKLEKTYKNKFEGELAITYWGSRLIWEWQKGSLQTALQIGERIMREIQPAEYEKYADHILNFVHLLILNERCENAKTLIFSMLEVFDCKIRKTGYGNPLPCLGYERIFLSMYIYILKKTGSGLQPGTEEAERLLEKVMHCKTIEKEIKGCLHKNMDRTEVYNFRQAHRKLAALEMREKYQKEGDADYEEKKRKCLLEVAECESAVSKIIALQDSIHIHKYGEIRVPDNAVCAEYFAYFDFRKDRPMISLDDNAEVECRYLVFVLADKRGEVQIADIADIPSDEKLDEEVCILLDAIWDEEQNKTDEIKQVLTSLNQKLAAPVQRYAVGKKKLYLGLDYTMSLLPMDLIFSDGKGEFTNIICLDSICYTGSDTVIDIADSNALVIGNPKLWLHRENQEHALPCGELECVRIAEMFGTKAYVGGEAKQCVLWGKKSRDVIHISAHGAVRKMEEGVVHANSLFIYSYLLFAGYKDWEEGTRDTDCGNGIVPGDDFLFMDLSETKLVVLSACVSALGHSHGLDVPHGMRWAISAAGAENSITTLWEVDDDACAVMMLIFYRNLHTMPVSEALYQAKKRLRTITVVELECDSDLKQIWETAQNSVSKRAAGNDRPYAHWRHWAAYVCCHR